MTAARSYKKPMAVWAARRELADCAADSSTRRSCGLLEFLSPPSSCGARVRSRSWCSSRPRAATGGRAPIGDRHDPRGGGGHRGGRSHGDGRAGPSAHPRMATIAPPRTTVCGRTAAQSWHPRRSRDRVARRRLHPAHARPNHPTDPRPHDRSDRGTRSLAYLYANRFADAAARTPSPTPRPTTEPTGTPTPTPAPRPRRRARRPHPSSVSVAVATPASFATPAALAPRPSRCPRCRRFPCPRSIPAVLRGRSTWSSTRYPTPRTDRSPASACRYRSSPLVAKVDAADGAATIEGGLRALHAVELR